MTVKPSLFSNCYIKNLHSPKKFVRLLWTLVITALVIFWAYFSYRQASIDTLKTSTSPIAFGQQKQYPIDSHHIKDATSYYKHNRNKAELESLLLKNTLNTWRDVNHTNTVDVTVLINTQDITYAKAQIRSALAQSLQPKQIYVYYTSETTKIDLQELLQGYDSVKVEFIYLSTTFHSGDILYVRDAFWLQSHYPISTQYTWVMEPNAIPDYNYLSYTYALLNTPDYKYSLIAYEASIILSTHNKIKCIQSQHIKSSQYVDMVHGNWLLRTSWIQLLKQELNNNAVTVLDLPLSYFISSSLLYRANIPSVAIPSNLKLSSPSFCSQQVGVPISHSVLPTVTQQKVLYSQTSNRLVLLFDDADTALELFPLLCRLFKSNKQIHVILTHGLTQSAFTDVMESLDDCKGLLTIHDITMAYNNGVNEALMSADYVAPTLRLLEFLQAQVLIRVQSKDAYYSRTLKVETNIGDTVTIHLPAGQVQHALWISDLPIPALQRWYDVKIDLAVITDKRPESLARLLYSTNEAYYLGDNQIELVIHMEQTADTATRTLVQSFKWNQGNKKVRHRIKKGGLMPAIVESWYPSDNNNYGVLLEDDIELSPFYYAWAKYNILKYRYSPNEREACAHIYGVSLYSPRNLELKPEGRRPFDPAPVLKESGYSQRAPYASQVPCSWGAVYFPEHWREFHTYLTERLVKEDWKSYYNISVPESRSNHWKKSWKKYFIELVYLRAYVMVYPNFEGFESFSTNHLEFGTHVQKNNRAQFKVDQFRVPLMQQDTILSQLPNERLPEFTFLPLMDLWGNVKTMEELKKKGYHWQSRVSSCTKGTSPNFDPSDLLCPFTENAEKYNHHALKTSK